MGHESHVAGIITDEIIPNICLTPSLNGEDIIYS